MGLILDTSVLIAAEKGQFNLSKLFEKFAREEIFIAAITASELLRGVERAQPPTRKRERSAYVEFVLTEIETIDFDLAVAREHAKLWAALEKLGKMIDPYDALIAASALHYGYSLATLNIAEFKRISGMKLVDVSPFAR